MKRNRPPTQDESEESGEGASSAADQQEMPTESTSSSEEIAGERGESTLSHARSLQSRIGNVLALGLLSTLGIGFLVWYYMHTFSRQTQAKDTAQAAVREQAQGDLPLPSLGEIEPPDSALGRVLGGQPEEPPPDEVPDAWLQPATEMPAQPMQPASYAAPTAKTPEELMLERRLAGPAFSQNPALAALGPTPYIQGQESDESIGSEANASAATASPLAGLLRPSATPAVRAKMLPASRLLLPKGAFLDCTLETAIDSTLPGMTTCITATDTFGVDGSTVLMERGSKLIGETRGEVRQGSSRVFVLWTQARTPKGVVIPLASPGTDELGRSGLPGQVNRHFFERFGAAILVSVIDGAIQREVQSNSSGGTVIYDPSSSQDIMTEVLKSTINIPPTVVKHQGDRIQILVARDLDFRSVYELRPSTTGR